jgi:tetratricopeptide (TPR) repeat protein
MPTLTRQQLLNLLDARLAPNDLKNIVFDLGLEWGNLGGDETTKQGRLRNLIDLYEKRREVDALIQAIYARRDDLSLDHVVYRYPVSQEVTYESADSSLNTKILIQRGITRLDAGLVNSALDDFTAVINVDASNGLAYYWRGRIYTSLENFEAAIPEYTDAIFYQPDHAKSYYYRGLAWPD